MKKVIMFILVFMFLLNTNFAFCMEEDEQPACEESNVEYMIRDNDGRELGRILARGCSCHCAVSIDVGIEALKSLNPKKLNISLNCSLPDLSELEGLEVLYCPNCSMFTESRLDCCRLPTSLLELYLPNFGESLLSDICGLGRLRVLRVLSLSGTSISQSSMFWSTIPVSLRVLNVSNCYSLSRLPGVIDRLRDLFVLDIRGSAVAVEFISKKSEIPGEDNSYKLLELAADRNNKTVNNVVALVAALDNFGLILHES